jgi:hypothetical protein
MYLQTKNISIKAQRSSGGSLKYIFSLFSPSSLEAALNSAHRASTTN